MSDPFHCNIMSLFVRLFNEDFSEYTWDATKASLNLNIKPSNYGFKVILMFTKNKNNSFIIYKLQCFFRLN